MSAVFKKVLVFVMLVALLVPAMPALCEEALVEPGGEALVEPGEEAPAELGEMNLFDPGVYDGEYAEQEANVGPLQASHMDGNGIEAPEGNGAVGVTVRNVTLRASQRFQTRVTFYAPYGGYMYAYSSNTAVMQCGWNQQYDGNADTLNIVGIAAGTATVTITNTQDNEKVYIYVTVLPFQSIYPQNVTVRTGERTSVKISFPGGTLYPSIDNGRVCTIAWDTEYRDGGVVLFIIGLSAGTATVKITNSYNRETSYVRVTVTAPHYPKTGKKDGKQYCRALLIGEEAFNPICTRNTGDTELMARMLQSVKGPKGKSWSIRRYKNMSNNDVKDSIFDTFRNADEDDLSLFFIATHGNSSSTGENAGALAMIPSGSLKMTELAEVLKAVPGKVIVIIQACGAGAGIFGTYAEQNDAKKAMKSAAKAFDNAVIDAFAEADPGVVENDYPEPLPFGVEQNTGELRVKNKFYVLAAARYQENSYGNERNRCNFFVKWLTDGIGTSGKMAADTNKNGQTTLKELFKYISKVGDNTPITSQGKKCYQHVQAYPKNSNFDLFKR